MTGAHEDYSRDDAVRPSSNRTLGIVFAFFFAIVTLLPLLRGRHPRWWAAPISALFLVAALLVPNVLAPLNRAWTALAASLHKITNPIILGAFFYLVITPFGWLLRRLGKDFLRLKPEPLQSYWIARQPPGPPPESMSHQF